MVGDGFLNQPCQGLAAIALTARHFGEVNIDFVHTSVFHHGRNVGDDVFESSGIKTVLVKIYRQQNRVGTQLRSLHHAHGRAHTKCPCGIGGGGDDAAPCIAGQAWKNIDRYLAQMDSSGPFAFRL